MNHRTRDDIDDHEERPCLGRRQFLMVSGSAAVTTVVLSSIPGMAWAKGIKARVAKYPRKLLASISKLHEGVAVPFKYPTEHPLHAASFLVKLGTEAGGGIGPDRDVVAFNALCPHMGGPLMGKIRHEHAAVGPCPFHLTTFDLTKHGMVIAGHATESLPQVVLEIDNKNGDIYATGILGLIYGTHNSFQA